MRKGKPGRVVFYLTLLFPALSNSEKVREGFGVEIGLSYKNSTLTIKVTK
jgi:hypothetical protein